MLRKKCTILLLLVAQLIILGHDLVPHHHHTDLTSQEHHHHDQDSKDDHPEDDPIDLLFSNFIHDGEQITFTRSNGTRITITKRAVQPRFALPYNFAIPFAYAVGFQKHTFPPDRQIKYQPPLYGAYSLRGPPTFIVG